MKLVSLQFRDGMRELFVENFAVVLKLFEYFIKHLDKLVAVPEFWNMYRFEWILPGDNPRFTQEIHSQIFHSSWRYMADESYWYSIRCWFRTPSLLSINENIQSISSLWAFMESYCKSCICRGRVYILCVISAEKCSCCSSIRFRFGQCCDKFRIHSTVTDVCRL